MKKLNVTEISAVEMDIKTDNIVGDKTLSKSAKMKQLFDLGYDVKAIATLLNVRYNFVYNVVQNMVIVEGVEVTTNRESSKKDEVWRMLDEGKTTKEIAVDLKTNYNYVYKLKKEWEAAAVEAAKQADVVVATGTDDQVVENKKEPAKRNKKKEA